ncbi:MAG: WecB/TagA/CpsF family glycosyltransferase [Leptolyngbya sp. RL_3_1]|nr:WecB/TagA/CpsF family glycosyltransferase [Leptolyngbya sp. RL_3_1]
MASHIAHLMSFKDSPERSELLGERPKTSENHSGKGISRMQDDEIVEILDVPINNISAESFLKNLRSGVIFTPNVDHLMTLQHDQAFRETYQQADYRLCDSQILIYASYLLGKPFKEKISGSDLLPLFCDYHKCNEHIKIFLLGGAEGVPQKAQANINARIGRKIVVESYSPPFGFESDAVECQKIIDKISGSSANVLAVGLGAPKQEKWIIKYRDQLSNIDIFMGIGAAVDFEAGNKERSPKWMSELGLEWFYRFVQEPGRLWKRYFVRDVPFLWLLAKQIVRENIVGKG